MHVVQTKLQGVLLLEPTVFRDERGFFLESWNQRTLDDATGIHLQFVQDNHSCSTKGVLRGLHYQIENAQGKLVRVTNGSVFDVVVDLRKSSLTFGQWIGEELSAANQKQLWIPPGFAHGFVVLSDTADFLYKTTNYYVPGHEQTIRWDDPELAIKWPIEDLTLIVSEKDKQATSFKSAKYFS